MKLPRSPSTLHLVAAALLLAAAGCCCCGRRENHCQFDCDYEKATVVYELSGSCGALASTAIRRAYAMKLDEGDITTFVAPNRLTWQSAIVTIQYPHPVDGPCSARATIRLSRRLLLRSSRKPRVTLGRPTVELAHRLNPKSQAPPVVVEAPPRVETCESPDEIWSMDITKQELDLLLCDLSATGFFSQQWRPNGGGHLYVELDKCLTRKVWTPEPKLDDLIARVFGEGTLEMEAPEGTPTPRDVTPSEPGRTRVTSPPESTDLAVPPAPAPELPEPDPSDRKASAAPPFIDETEATRTAEEEPPVRE